ncbi:hypothetical protein WA026_021753 [Henosepilachna vigintioctopunctata]|uniref:Uncharacterized protein n=1 Tax=Henosepilachna vigintioctopunctata TaxID=420089 RepID=A0AAW1TY35_9CUCU
MLLWRRRLYVLSERNRDHTNATDFSDHLPANLCVPEEIGHYLNRIDNINDLNERQSFLELIIPLVHYDMYKETKRLIQCMGRCPRHSCRSNEVEAQSDNDVEQKEDQAWPIDWDVPAAFRPHGNCTSNRNLLGWSPAMNITNDMTIQFEQFMIPGPIHTVNVHGKRSVFH